MPLEFEATQHRYRLQIGPHDLHTGQYKIEVSDKAAGLQFDVPEFTLTRGGKVLVTARIVPSKTLGGLNAEAFAWYPDDCTFFVGRDFRVQAGLSDEQLTILLQVLADAGWRERIWKLKSIIGRVDRITAAFAPNDKNVDRAKILIRITGQLNRQRLVDFFTTEFQYVKADGGGGPAAGSMTILHNLQPWPVAAAIVDHTDLVIGGYVGRIEPHVEVICEAMRVRAGQRPSARPRYELLTSRVSADAWGIIAGAPPEPVRSALTLALTPLNRFPPAKTAILHVQWPGIGSVRSDRIVAAPQSVVVSLQGVETTRVNLDAHFRTSQEATSLANGLRSVRLIGRELFKEPPPLIRLTPTAQAIWTTVLKGIQIERTDDRVQASIEVPKAAMQALTETIRQTPFSSIRSLLSSLNRLFPEDADGARVQPPKK